MPICEGFKVSFCIFEWIRASEPACEIVWAGIIIPIMVRTDAEKGNAL